MFHDVTLRGSLQTLIRKTDCARAQAHCPRIAEVIPQTLTNIRFSATMQNLKGSAIIWSHVCLYSFSGVIVLLEKAARKLFSGESFLSKPLSLLTEHILATASSCGCGFCLFVHVVLWVRFCYCCYSFTAFERLFHEWRTGGVLSALSHRCCTLPRRKSGIAHTNVKHYMIQL